jgi:hypothetical protein
MDRAQFPTLSKPGSMSMALIDTCCAHARRATRISVSSHATTGAEVSRSIAAMLAAMPQ